MKLFPLFILLLPVCSITAAQSNNKLTAIDFAGYLVDSDAVLPLDKATLTLTTTDQLPGKTGSLTNNRGFFIFKHILPGTYLLTAEFQGYRPYSKKIQLTDSLQYPGYADTIRLYHEPQLMQRVVVTTLKNVIEYKTDRLIYNVDKDITSQGGVATDVLRKIPQVTVDINGNVELLGNPSIRFLINGKPSSVFGNNSTDVLQSIPASQIQTIEIMSSPGAKYDASGTGGIINIILKKNKAKGFSGVVNGTAGTRLENGAVNISYKKNNFGITGYFTGSSQLKTLTHINTERISADTVTQKSYYLIQDGRLDYTRFGFRSGLGIDWDITPKDNLSFSAGHNHFGNTNTGRTQQFNSSKDNLGNTVYDQTSIRNSDTRFSNYSFEGGLDYKRRLEKEKEELAFSLTYSSSQNNSYYQQSQQYTNTDSLFSGSRSNNPGQDHLTTISLDYSDPVTSSLLLEMGVKAELESLISNSVVYSFSPGLYNYLFDDKQTYQSEFKRQVYAGYVSGSFPIGNWLNVLAGARLEYTGNEALYSKRPGFKIPDYYNFAPALKVLHTFEKQQTLKFSYAYRLERPEYRDLNPFVNLSDPHNISTGNPAIKPEIGHDFQLGYNQPFSKENSLNMVLVYTYNKPDIKSYTTFYPIYKVGDSVYTDVNVTMRSNIASETRWGVNIFSSLLALSKMGIRATVQLYERRTNNVYSTPKSISGFEYRGNLNLNYQFNHGLIAEAFGNYNSGLRWQGRRAAFSSYTIALRQSLFKGKGSAGLTAVNAFGKYLTQKSTQVGTGFTGNSRLQIPYRSIGISFLYKFGKIKISKSKEEENYLTKPPPDSL